MRVLMLGAGGVGGYFGGRMVQGGTDVTFLVRTGRAEQLRTGLVIESPRGNAIIPVRTISDKQGDEAFDIIVLACKAYSLDAAFQTITPFVMDGTPILPLLNGYRHIEQLQDQFPSAVIWGGTAGISAVMTRDGVVRQLHPNQVIAIGQLSGHSDSGRLLAAMVTEMQRAGISALVKADIQLAMWEKWSFLATLAASTCLSLGTIGQILATDHGEQLICGLFEECNAVAAAEGWAPAPNPVQDYRGMLLDRNSHFTASMMRDMESGGPTEADHIVGDMIARGNRHGIKTQLLQAAYTRLQVYENQRPAAQQA